MKKYMTWIMSAVALLVLTGCNEEKPREEIIRPVKTMTISSLAQMSSRSFPGVTKATQDATLAFEVSGKLQTLPVKIGDKIRQAQVLATLDPRDYQNQLKIAQAERDRAHAQYERVKKAADAGAVSKQNLSDAQASYDSAEAKVSIMLKSFDDTKLTAPFAGEVVEKYVENFENVQAKQSIVRILDRSSYEMTIDIPEQLRLAIPRVENVWVTLDAYPDRKIPAEIKEVGSNPSLTTRTYPITLKFSAPSDLTVMPGMAGNAGGNMRSPENERFVTIPLSALMKEGSAHTVWVVTPERTLKKVSVTLHAQSPLFKDGVNVVGLTEGNIIVTAGVTLLSENQKVKLLDKAIQ